MTNIKLGVSDPRNLTEAGMTKRWKLSLLGALVGLVAMALVGGASRASSEPQRVSAAEVERAASNAGIDPAAWDQIPVDKQQALLEEMRSNDHATAEGTTEGAGKAAGYSPPDRNSDLPDVTLTGILRIGQIIGAPNSDYEVYNAWVSRRDDGGYLMVFAGSRLADDSTGVLFVRVTDETQYKNLRPVDQVDLPAGVGALRIVSVDDAGVISLTAGEGEGYTFDPATGVFSPA
jgi:hypothetical protein